MNIFEIDQQIEELLLGSVNEETGELVFNDEELEKLAIARETKVENLCCFIKNKKAYKDACKAEIEKIQKRVKTAENQINNAEEYLRLVLDGNNFSSAKAQVSFRKAAPAVEYAPEFIGWALEFRPDFFVKKEPVLDKEAIKKWLKDGGETPYAKLTSKTSMIIK